MTGRVTSKKLIEFLNKKFDEYKIDSYEVYDITRTRFSANQYAAGACKLYIHFRLKSDKSHCGYFLSFYSLGEINEYVKEGYQVAIKSRNRTLALNDFEIDFTKCLPTILNHNLV